MHASLHLQIVEQTDWFDHVKHTRARGSQ